MRYSKCCTFNILFLKCLFYALKYMGVVPISIDTGTSEKHGAQGIRFVSSKSGIIYNWILACLTVYPSYMTISYLTSSEYTQNLELNKIIDVLQSTFAMITSTFLIINICIRQEKVVSLANQLTSAHRTVMDLAIDADNTVRSDAIISCYKKIVSINLASTIIWIASSPPENYENLGYFIFTSLYNIVIHAVLLQYSLVLKFLHQLYQSVNAQLLALLSEPSAPLDSNIICFTLRRLKKLRAIHVMLCRTSYDVSNFYSLPMLFCMTHVFLTLTIYCYYVIMTLIVWNIDEKPVLVILNCMALITLLALSITILTRIAGVTAIENKITGEIVSESTDNWQSYDVINQLNGFSNYLMHKAVHFSVFNLFLLNESLLISIASSITTYLVILLDFEKDSAKK